MKLCSFCDNENKMKRGSLCSICYMERHRETRKRVNKERYTRMSIKNKEGKLHKKELHKYRIEMLSLLNNRRGKCALCSNLKYCRSNFCEEHLNDPIIKSILKKINQHKGKRTRKLLCAAGIYRMLEQQDFRCKRTGVRLFCEKLNTTNVPYNYMSIDRIDSSKGYTMDNIEIVCYMFNVMKNRFSYGEVLEIAKGIIKNSE